MIFSLTSGFLLGISGSLHCIGMCGPFKSIFFIDNKADLLWVSHLLYDFGRLLIYCFIGLIFSGISGLVNLQFLQNNIAFFCAFILFFYLLLKTGIIKGMASDRFNFHRFPTKFYTVLKINNPTIVKYLFAGILNGLLPCGLTYIAGMTSAGFGNINISVYFMFGFWLGTLPAMMFSSHIIRLWIKRIPYISSILILIVIIILVYRGVVDYNHVHESKPEYCPPSLGN